MSTLTAKIVSSLSLLLVLACSSAALFACSTTIQPTLVATGSSSEAVPFASIQSIMTQRCTACHSSSPSYSGFSAPAGRLDLSSPAAIQAAAAQIKVETVLLKTMPDRNNITGMSDAERALLKQWIEQGAKLE